MLETWALDQVPHDWRELNLNQELLAKSNSVEALRIADHRLAYLEYEGPVSGNRGCVRRLDAGQYRVGTTPTSYVLDGQLVRGEIEIVSRPNANATFQLTYRAGNHSRIRNHVVRGGASLPRDVDRPGANFQRIERD